MRTIVLLGVLLGGCPAPKEIDSGLVPDTPRPPTATTTATATATATPTSGATRGAMRCGLDAPRKSADPCNADADCAPEQPCHARACVAKAKASPAKPDTVCTYDMQCDTVDANDCRCFEGRCALVPR